MRFFQAWKKSWSFNISTIQLRAYNFFFQLVFDEKEQDQQELIFWFRFAIDLLSTSSAICKDNLVSACENQVEELEKIYNSMTKKSDRT